MSVMFVFQLCLLVFYLYLLLFSLKITWITFQNFYQVYYQKGIREAAQPFIIYAIVCSCSLFIMLIFPNIIMKIVKVFELPYTWLTTFVMGICY